MGGFGTMAFNSPPLTFDEQDSTTVSASYIDQIPEDSKHRFWVGTLNGFNQMDRKTGKFKRYLHNEMMMSTAWATIKPKDRQERKDVENMDQP